MQVSASFYFATRNLCASDETACICSVDSLCLLQVNWTEHKSQWHVLHEKAMWMAALGEDAFATAMHLGRAQFACAAMGAAQSLLLALRALDVDNEKIYQEKHLFDPRQNFNLHVFSVMYDVREARNDLQYKGLEKAAQDFYNGTYSRQAGRNSSDPAEQQLERRENARNGLMLWRVCMHQEQLRAWSHDEQFAFGMLLRDRASAAHMVFAFLLCF